MVDDSLEELVEKAIQMAREGDIQALTFLLGRRIPMPKPTDHPAPFDLPEGIGPGDLGKMTLSVLRAVAEGKMDPTSAAKICSALTSSTHLASTSDVERLNERLAEIERMFQGKPGTINVRSSDIQEPRMVAEQLDDEAPSFQSANDHTPNGGDDG
jgi:hypothetical protein